MVASAFPAWVVGIRKEAEEGNHKVGDRQGNETWDRHEEEVVPIPVVDTLAKNYHAPRIQSFSGQFWGFYSRPRGPFEHSPKRPNHPELGHPIYHFPQGVEACRSRREVEAFRRENLRGE